MTGAETQKPPSRSVAKAGYLTGGERMSEPTPAADHHAWWWPDDAPGKYGKAAGTGEQQLDAKDAS